MAGRMCSRMGSCTAAMKPGTLGDCDGKRMLCGGQTGVWCWGGHVALVGVYCMRGGTWGGGVAKAKVGVRDCDVASCTRGGVIAGADMLLLKPLP